MPVVTVSFLKGRSYEKKKRIVEGITKVVSKELEVPAEAVTVIINEKSPENLAKGGKFFKEILESK
ncbi:MAG: Tautomerase enzyme [Thermosediminibacterales bacterium]|nr:Tautomerase enzyme [Thermosediminibacterales bacterium]MDK2836913.1 Tautomerase enzyme [Thermosediminibacterales bacterium]